MEKESCLLGCLRENKNKCHSKLDLESHRFLKRQQGEILNQVQDDAFFYNNGFTLIELLVVVLIIGILAAVAVPQYQKAVWKSRAMQLLTLTKSVSMAQEAHYLATNEYAGSFEELDLDFDMLSPGFSSSFGTTTCSTDGVRKNDNLELVIGCSTSTNANSIRGSFREGPYYSAGFRVFFATAVAGLKTHQMYCIEPQARISPAGIFCSKIFGATYILTEQAVRYYEMP